MQRGPGGEPSHQLLQREGSNDLEDGGRRNLISCRVVVAPARTRLLTSLRSLSSLPSRAHTHTYTLAHAEQHAQNGGGTRLERAAGCIGRGQTTEKSGARVLQALNLEKRRRKPPPHASERTRSQSCRVVAVTAVLSFAALAGDAHSARLCAKNSHRLGQRSTHVARTNPPPGAQARRSETAPAATVLTSPQPSASPVAKSSRGLLVPYRVPSVRTGASTSSGAQERGATPTSCGKGKGKLDSAAAKSAGALREARFKLKPPGRGRRPGIRTHTAWRGARRRGDVARAPGGAHFWGHTTATAWRRRPSHATHPARTNRKCKARKTAWHPKSSKLPSRAA